MIDAASLTASLPPLFDGYLALGAKVRGARKRDLLRAIPALEWALADGELVLLFLEGTTTAGERILRFRSALFEAAVRAGTP